MKKILLLVLVILLSVSMPVTTHSQTSRPIEPDCCFLIYGTGRWLGWAASLLEYTRIRTRPVVYDQAIVDCLNKVNQSLEATNWQCGSALEAWPDWRYKQRWINLQISKLRTPSTGLVSHHDNRNQVWRQIEQAYHTWANDLSVQRFNGETLKQVTCSTCYFKLGFDTAYAGQAFRQADESFKFGNYERGEEQLQRAKSYLGRALEDLRAYYAIQRRISFSIRCVDLSALHLGSRINRITNSALNKYNYRVYMDDALRLSDEIADTLRHGCLLAAGDSQGSDNGFEPGGNGSGYSGTYYGNGNGERGLWQILRRRQYGAPPNCYEFLIAYVGGNRVSSPGVLTPLAIREGWEIDNELGSGSGPGGTWLHFSAASSRTNQLSSYGGDLYGCRNSLNRGAQGIPDYSTGTTGGGAGNSAGLPVRRPPSRPSFAGKWDTNWGTMILDAGGNGTYTHDKGRIRGSVHGGVLTGTWSEAPSYKPPKDAGDVEFTLSADGNSFTGKWRYGHSGNWHYDWRGQRIE